MYLSKKRKSLSFLAVLMLLISSLFTGCGGNSSGTDNASQEKSTQKADTVAQKPQLDPYEIKWYIDAGPQQADLESVQDEMNKILKDKINATIKITSVDMGTYDQKMQMVMQSGEAFDLCFTSNWANKYLLNVDKGAYVELNGLIDQYAPTIKETLPKIGWDAVKVKGKIFAIPNYQIWTMTNEIVVKKDLADKYSFDPSKVTKFEDLTPFLENVKKGEQGITPAGFHKNYSAWETGLVMYGFDEIAGRNIPGVVKINDSTTTVVNQFETDEFKASIKLMRDWYQKGLLRKDAATANDLTADMKAGKVAFCTGGDYKPGGDVVYKAQFGGDIYNVPISKSYMLTSMITATMTAVSKTSKDPARAVMFYDLMFSDKDLYNLMVLGIENKHYKADADGKVEMIPNSGYDYSAFAWEFGNQFNQKIMQGQSDTVWEDTIKINDNAEGSPILGFNFNPEPVKSELAKCNSIISEYLPMLSLGSVDPDKILPTFLSKLKSAGSDAILAEEQKQINQWKADNGK